MIKLLLKYSPLQIFSALNVFVLISIQTRFLAPAEYGLLAIAVILMEFVRSICTQWLNTSMLRIYPSAAEDEKHKIINNISFMTLISLFTSLFILGLLFFYYDFFSWDFYISFAVLITSKSIFQFKLDYARLKDKYKSYSFATLSQSVFSVVLTFIFLNLSSSIEGAVLGLAFSYVIGLLFLESDYSVKFDMVRAKNTIAYGVPLMFAGSISLLYSRSDRLVMPSYLDMNIVGVYAAQANLLAGVLGLVFMVIATPLYPQLAKDANNLDKLFTKHSVYLAYLILLTLPVLIGICMLSDQIINLVLGNEYISASPYMFTFLAISFYIINFRQHYVDQALQFMLKTHFLIPISAVSVVITFSILPYMLKKYGADGGALSILLATLVSVILSFITAIKLGYKFEIQFDVFKIFLSAIVMAVVLYLFIELNGSSLNFFTLFFSSFVAFFTYIISCFGFNVLNIRGRLRGLYSRNG